MNLTYSDWIKLKEKVPEYLVPLVDNCSKFYQKASFILSMRIIMPNPLVDLYGLLIKILNEYRGFVKTQRMSDEKLIKDVESRIDAIFENVLTVTTSQGKKYIDLTGLVENTDIKAHYLITIADTFLDGVIYQGLNESYNKFTSKVVFLGDFITNSIVKLGLPRQAKQADSGGDLDDLFSDDTSKKKKGKGKKEDEEE